MGLGGVLKVLNPETWLGGGDSVTVTYDRPSFVVDREEHDPLEDGPGHTAPGSRVRPHTDI